MVGSNHEPQAGTRASFVEPRVPQDSFYRVPIFTETNGNAAAQNTGFTFNPGAGIRTTAKRTPRKASTPFRPAQAQKQESTSPPLQEKQPSEAAQPEFFVFKAADEKPTRRTPAIRKAKARTATTPFAAATAAATAAAASGFATSIPTTHSDSEDGNEDGMAWSPSNTTTTEPIQQQKQPPSSSFQTSFLFNATSSTGTGTANVAYEFKTRLNLDEQQNKTAPNGTSAPNTAAAAPFTFSAGSPQATTTTAAASDAGLRPRRKGTPHRPAAPSSSLFPDIPTATSAPTSPPAFVFQAKPSQTTQQQQPAAAAAPKIEQQEQQQQQSEGFISLSQIRGTPGAPLRRSRPRTKPTQQQRQPTTSTSTSASFPSSTKTAAVAVAAAVPGLRRRDEGPGATTRAKSDFKPPRPLGNGPGVQPLRYTQPENLAALPFLGHPQKPQLTVEQQAQQASSNSDRYRIAGNEYFRKQKYEEAFKQYTQALNTLMPYPSVHTQLSLLLSNRAAASLALARPLQALQDCRMGLHHDSNFLKCALRMATCHCRLGEYSQAGKVLQQVRKGLKIFDAVGLKELESKEMEVKESMAMMIDILSALGYTEIQSIALSSSSSQTAAGTTQGNNEALTSGAEFLLSSLPQPPHPAPKRASLEELLKHLQTHGSYFPHAEMFHAARSETLLRLGRYQDALEAVEQLPHADAPASKGDAPWRTWIRTQVAFYQGQAPQAQKLLNSIEKIVPTTAAGSGVGSQGKNFGAAGASKESRSLHPIEDPTVIIPLPTIEEIHAIRTTLKNSEDLRETGNKAVGAKKYQAAIDAYTEALSSGSLSPALAAILYCNRAAAHQGLGNIALAVADCSRAKALSPGYAKAHSRSATLLAELGMYSSVVDELTAAISSKDITPTARAEYQNRLKVAKEAAAPKRTFYGATINPPPGNHYKILGLERGCPTDQVRKAYKKLALQLHPDKSSTACRVSFQMCATSGSELSGPAAETQKRLEEGASWVFKCLGEANETLSAPEKRRELDAELSAWEDASRSSRGGGGDGFGGFGGGPSYYYSPGGHHHQHSSYSAYGAYYRPHAQPSYNFNRQQYGTGGASSSSSSSAGSRGGGSYRHYW